VRLPAAAQGDKAPQGKHHLSRWCRGRQGRKVRKLHWLARGHFAQTDPDRAPALTLLLCSETLDVEQLSGSLATQCSGF
jgi:hypothetical protein